MKSFRGTSQIPIVPSAEIEARVRPSGLQARLLILDSWPGWAREANPLATFHSLMLPLSDPEARVRPSGLHAMLWI